MPEFYSYIVQAKEERPEGEVEQVGLVASSPERALQMVAQEHGEGVGWDVKPFGRGRVSNSDFMYEHVVYVQKSPKRGPKRSANDLYALADEKEDVYDPYRFQRFFDINVQDIPEDANTRVSLRILYDPYIDRERCKTLGTLWLDGQPFAVTQEAGRDGGDHYDHFVTDAARYREAHLYLVSLYEPGTPDFTVINPDEPMRRLTDFYGGDSFLLDDPE